MTEIIKVLGYHAEVIPDAEKNVLGASGIDISAHAVADNMADLKREFEVSVREYLLLCDEEGLEPEKPYSGKFNIALSAEAHRHVELAAKAEGVSMRRWTADTLDRAARAATEKLGGAE